LRVRVIAIALVVGLGAPVAAQPSPPHVPTPAEAAEIVVRRSPGWAAIHVVGVNLGAWGVGLALGKDYLHISPSSIWHNISGGWAWDDDAFTTNQFGHPYLGNLAFNAARSNGIGFWGSALAAFGSSLFWELVMETETPSINDQLFTPAGGVLLGEALHRVGAAIRWRDDAFPSRALAVAVDPMGAISRWTHGDAYVLTEPPPHFGYLAFGWNGLSVDFDAPDGQRLDRVIARVHGVIAQSYGLPIDGRVRPRRPLDYFDFDIEGDLDADAATLSLHTRGLLWGRELQLRRGGAFGGLMAIYDFSNESRTRASAIALGPGGVIHQPLGARWFGQAGLTAGFVPYGAAGADVLADPDDATHADKSYHRGPGATAVLDMRLGWRGRGLAYVNAHSYWIDGALFDDGSELVTQVRMGLIAGIVEPHALQLEAVFATRRGRFSDHARDVDDSSAQLRVAYTFVSDFGFGGSRASRR
jgi:hypothetical protein